MAAAQGLAHDGVDISSQDKGDLFGFLIGVAIFRGGVVLFLKVSASYRQLPSASFVFHLWLLQWLVCLAEICMGYVRF